MHVYSVFHNILDDVSHGAYINGDIFAYIAIFYLYVRIKQYQCISLFGDKWTPFRGRTAKNMLNMTADLHTGGS